MHPFFFALGKILSVEVSRGIGEGLGEWEPGSTQGLQGSAHNAVSVGKTLGAGLAGCLEVVGRHRQ